MSPIRRNGSSSLSREEALYHVDACRASGKSMKAYAEEHGLDFYHLRGWASHVHQSKRPAEKKLAKPQFVEIRESVGEQNACCVTEVVVDERIRLVLRDGVGLKELGYLIDQVRGSTC